LAIILEGSDNAIVMWGKIGPYQIHRSKQGKMYLKNHVIPFDPRTIAQLNQRQALQESNFRWKNYEKLINQQYWNNIKRLYKFSSAYCAYQSSCLITYSEKLAILGNHNLAINFIKDTNNPITYKESLYRKNLIKKNKEKINTVLRYRKSADYKTKLKASIEYLKVKGWLTKTKYGMIPYINASLETDLKIKNIVPSNGGFGTATYGKGTFGTQKIV